LSHQSTAAAFTGSESSKVVRLLRFTRPADRRRRDHCANSGTRCEWRKWRKYGISPNR
jgi:hypothetical protein